MRTFHDGKGIAKWGGITQWGGASRNGATVEEPCTMGRASHQTSRTHFGIPLTQIAKSLVMWPDSIVSTQTSSSALAKAPRAAFPSSFARWARPRVQAKIEAAVRMDWTQWKLQETIGAERVYEPLTLSFKHRFNFDSWHRKNINWKATSKIHCQ